MESSSKDYYAILGVAPSADLKEIKRRYRELALRYHPDVNPTPEAARKITEINEAYDVLSDPERRSRYDTERLFMATRLQHSTPTSPKSRTTSSQKPSAPTSQPKVDFNGFGRVVQEETPSRPRQAPFASQTTTASRSARAEKFLHEAQLAFYTRRYAEAERLCRQAIALNVTLSPAHELLGDLLARRGDKENAIAAYSYAVQFNPNNYQAQAKLERLTIKERSQRARPHVTLSQSHKVSLWEALYGMEREIFLAIIAAAAAFALACVFALLYLFPGERLVADISFNLIFALIFGGFLSGLLLSLYGRLHPLSQCAQIYVSRHKKLPIAALLAFLALLWIGLSLLVYLLGATWQWVRFRKRLSRSLLMVYGCAFLLSVLFWLIYRPSGSSGGASSLTLLSAGNFLLPTLLAGWKIGDRLRLYGRISGV
ncbi:DnaJ-class molecular chaperone with C-terminal Zn finger domain [Chthonomonas calidirosea]|uniref:J domain-containing protein n=1 Tax=Chthonomonas calidirosea TaxID=454171 RepID=UPI0006DD4EEA|nr:DnaJ domain-containing protein [Chthonomonas calidirosea]CEK15736.1 DnaJ-class molecular chaperone with C-terminal Zn finger domain [Chthonomonas calidirosea]